MTGYEKNCHDTLDWEELDQIHKATLEISRSCFEFKKICVGLVGVSATVIVKFNSGALDYTFFIVPLLISLGFWIADTTSYFYQKQMRGKMDKILKVIAQRNNLSEYDRNETQPSWLESFFNKSMVLYYVLIILALVGVGSLKLEWIG